MKKRILAMCLTAAFVLSSCGKEEKVVLDPTDPVAITFWHSYNNLARTMLEDMIETFNDTIGAEQGIVVTAHGFGEQERLEEALFLSSTDAIGSEKMPDMFMAYSDNAYRIDRLKPLVDFNKYFSKEELKEYRQEFLQEGLWSEGNVLKSIPIAKSTELLYLNKTDWEAFAAKSESMEKTTEETFSTWENIVEASEIYYKESGGNPFLAFNLNNDLMHVTATQLGMKPYVDGSEGVTFQYSQEFAKKIWDICYVPHINGWFASSFYNQDAMRQGGLLAYIGSSAGSGFFPLEVTPEPENTYAIEGQVLEYPTFENAERYLTQRGANVCVTASDEKHEYAAAEFIKWFTGEEMNTKFAVATGYIPVKEAALKNKEQIIANLGESKNKSALENTVDITLRATETTKFAIKTPFANSYEANTAFSFGVFDQIEADLLILEERIQAGEDRERVIAALTSEESFNAWYEKLVTGVNEALGK